MTHLIRVAVETRKDNEARLRPWPKELTVENVASWIWSNAGLPVDAHPILRALRTAGLTEAAFNAVELNKPIHVDVEA